MINLRDLYRRNVFGIMGTLVFHILLFVSFWIAEQNLSAVLMPEESVLIDFVPPQDMESEPIEKRNKDENAKDNEVASRKADLASNQAVNDAAPKDRFFDKRFQQEIEDAKKLVSDVNTQLSKKALSTKQIKMPEVTTEGMERDSIRNVIYSGKSNIHYYLENRYHVRLSNPVYLAKGGGKVVVDIQVNREGRVVRAESRVSGRLEDQALPQYAVSAAEQTIFNGDPKAPAIQKGTITYNFVAQ